MNDAELRKLAKDSGVPLQKIAEWHFIHGPQFASAAITRHNARPPGTLALTDIVAKYNVTPATVLEWRRAGLHSRRHRGKMVVIKKSDLEEWIAKHPIIRRPPGRPRRSPLG